MDFKQIIQIVFGMAGGLSLFIFGMNLMSESLQKVAGQRMRAVLGALTKNPVLGVLAGALVTAAAPWQWQNLLHLSRENGYWIYVRLQGERVRSWLEK